ncbi:MAG: TIGR04283 family arsenosugar biosynthesis glycosyltransferase [Verrucomicrobiales bacterium]|nr:TIGR04283 family arsenosugar biosynthesis glycosyltransferase [Verrucomicrobiales bacterium]
MSKLSVIIPTLNESECLSDTVEALRNSLVHEIVVVDGGSSDSTVEIAKSAGCRVLENVEGGRTAQLNRGAEESHGTLLLFLHADTTVPALALKRMKIKMGGSDLLVGGGFARRFDSSSPVLAFTSRIAGLRGYLLGVFLGDQGIFVRKDAFELLGGFDEEFGPGEDIDFSVRMKRLGKTVLISPPVVSSARRFTERGPWKQTLEDWKVGKEMYQRAKGRGEL